MTINKQITKEEWKYWKLRKTLENFANSPHDMTYTHTKDLTPKDVTTLLKLLDSECEKSEHDWCLVSRNNDMCEDMSIYIYQCKKCGINGSVVKVDEYHRTRTVSFTKHKGPCEADI